MAIDSGRRVFLIFIICILTGLTGLVLFKFGFFQQFNTPPQLDNQSTYSYSFTEGTAFTPTITVGPFDIHRRYRSMEGPYADTVIKIGDLVASKNTIIPEGMVKFIERDQGAPSMNGGSGNSSILLKNSAPKHIALFWVKGFKLEVLDENNKVQPTAEFICHFNLDVNSNQRNRLFPEGERCHYSRILTITQGQTNITFPEGYGIPVASNETWRFTFQAANRTTNIHRRIKHRLTLYLIPDSQLVRPIAALSWYTPYIKVVVDKNSPAVTAQEKLECPMCLPIEQGVTAPNSVFSAIYSDEHGRKLCGHWVVPPGQNTWASPIKDLDFASKDRVIHAIWSHIHPCCTSFSLVKVSMLGRQPIITVACKTKTKPGLQIENIDYISSKKGIGLPGGNKYELDITYNNPTPEALDSMATMGIFFEDNSFARPSWVYKKTSEQFCGIKEHSNKQLSSSSSSSVTNSYTSNQPIFNINKDGPLLIKPEKVKIQTTEGNLIILLDPDWAPKTATQMAKLFANHAFDGTEICRYKPDFIFQVAIAEDKAPGYAPNTASVTSLIRRIPVEVNSQLANEVSHRAGTLSMARYENDPFGNTTSFSILLNDAPHLNNKYTIFGKLTNNPENQRTLEKMKAHWPRHPCIVRTSVISR